MTGKNSCELNFLDSQNQEQSFCDISSRMRNNSDVQKLQQVIYRAISFLNNADFDIENPHQRNERDDIANGLLKIAYLLG